MNLATNMRFKKHGTANNNFTQYNRQSYNCSKMVISMVRYTINKKYGMACFNCMVYI